MEYEKCYVFEPEHTRPAKRRKLEPTGLQASWPVRQAAYRSAWRAQKDRIDACLASLNSATIAEISDFLYNTSSATPNERIPTGIISTGPDAASQLAIFEQLSSRNNLPAGRAFVSLSANAGSNLKTLLKAIIQQATARQVGIDDEEGEDERGAMSKGSRMLNYDFQILADFVQERNLDQVVLAFTDTEAFDGSLLSQLIETLYIWRDRIPFILLFSVATSLDFLQQRLSKDTVKCLQGQLFDVSPSEDVVEQVFEAVTQKSTLLWIGPGLMATTLERQSDYIQSVDSLVDAVQYANMSHYYANALSIFLDPKVEHEDIPDDHFQAVRTLPSFQTFCDWLASHSQPSELADLLEDDGILLAKIRMKVGEGRQILAETIGAINVLRLLQKELPQQQVTPKSKLYLQALSNKLHDSSLVRSLLLSIRKAPSGVVIRIIAGLCQCGDDEDIAWRCKDVNRELTNLTKSSDQSQPLRSEDDMRNSTLRTTVVAQKVELSKQKSTLSKQDEAYTAILRKFTDMLQSYFLEKFIDPTSMLFHEIFLYDLKSPHREVFTPRPRHAIERALAAPQDYLACDCCQPSKGESEESVLSSAQPATAVLYQLYLESGSMINAHDLWQAFLAVMGEERSEEQNMALFQRGLAELKFLGFVKGTRKRVDHVAKVAWRGL